MVGPREPRRLLDGLFGLPALRIAVWLSIFAALFPGVFTDPEQMLAFMDDHQFTNWEEADRLAIVEHGQLPLWNPYYCGGMVSAAAPESGVFAPDFLLRLAFGVIQGRRLAVVLFVVLGMEGLYRLSREARGSALSAAFAAVVGATSTTLLQTYLAMGWVNFFGFQLVPWAVLGLVKGRESVSWRLVGAMALGWIALAAGTYTAPYAGIALAFITLAWSATCLAPLRARELRATLASAGTVLAGGGALAVAKLVPMMLVMRKYPRVFTPVEVNPPMELLSGYWKTYAAVLVFAIVALFFRDRWARIFFATAALFFVLAMGQFAPWAPSSIMRKLPLVSGLRYPDRYMVLFHMFATLAAARGLSQLEDLARGALEALWAVIRAPGRRGELLASTASGVAAAGLAFMCLRPFVQPILAATEIPPHHLYGFDPPQRVAQEFKQARGNRRDAHIWPFAGRGTLYCFVGIPLPQSANLRADLEREEYPEDPSTAKVERVSWSPHAIDLRVEASAPARVIVNQNWNEHWTSNVGATVDAERLLAVDVPPGSHTVKLRYKDGSSVACMLFSLGTFFGMLLMMGRSAYPRARGRLAEYRQLLALRPPAPRASAPAHDDVVESGGAEPAGGEHERRRESGGPMSGTREEES